MPGVLVCHASALLLVAVHYGTTDAEWSCACLQFNLRLLSRVSMSRAFNSGLRERSSAVRSTNRVYGEKEVVVLTEEC